jgi:hypothetical protein
MDQYRRQKHFAIQDISNILGHDGNRPTEVDKIEIDGTDIFYLCRIDSDWGIRWERFEGEPCGGYEEWFFFGNYPYAFEVFEKIKKLVKDLNNCNDNSRNGEKV